MRALGLDGISKSQVSRLCQALDEEVERFRTRRLEGDNSSPAAGPFFKKVCDSQREWCRRVGGFLLRYEASPVISYNHFFARQG